MKKTHSMAVMMDLHITLKCEAARRGMKLQEYLDRVLRVGLRRMGVEVEKPLK